MSIESTKKDEKLTEQVEKKEQPESNSKLNDQELDGVAGGMIPLSFCSKDKFY